jgi:hypothetical protein
VCLCRARITAFNRAPSADKKSASTMVFDPMQVYIFKILFMNLALAPPRCGASQKKKKSKAKKETFCALPALQRPPISRNILLVFGLPQVSLPICPP